MSTLFRREAVAHATQRLAGNVVLATPVSVKTLGALLAAIVFGSVAFAFHASYARKATVIGYLVPDQGTIRATMPSAGTLQAIMVREGDTVERGQHIAVIDFAVETAGGNVGETVARGLQSETAAAQAKAQAQLARLDVERQQSVIRLDKAKIELTQLTAQLELQQRRLQLARDSLASGETIAKKGYLPRKEVEVRRGITLQAEQELAVLRRQVATVERDIADVQARLASIPHEMEAAKAELQTASALIQQRTADADQRRSQFVRAPVAGRIAALPVATGLTLPVGATISVIIPAGSHLEAELLAPSRSIGFIKVGHEVRLSLQAFPFQRFGTVPGTVRTVSTTVLAPNEIAIQGVSLQEPVYRLRVTMSREVMHAYGESIPMQPGMLLSADIVFDRRSLLEWLFDPIYAVRRRS